jgi:cobalt-zinc-cadmium efflux system outer membrane protein
MQILFILSVFTWILSGTSPEVFAQQPPIEKVADVSLQEKSGEALTLPQAVEEGLKSNRDLLAAKYGIPLAEADELTAGLWNNPSILFDTVFQPFGHNWNQTSAGGPRQYDLILSYPLDLSGKRSSGVKSAHEAVRIAEASYQDSVRLKVLDIRLAYVEVITQEHQLALAEEKETSLKNLVTITEHRVGKAGRLPLLLMRAQLALDQAKLDSRQREISLQAALVQLATQLGRNPIEPKKIVGTKLRDFKLVSIPAKDRLIAQALETRPDLQVLKLTLSKSGYDASLARAQAWNDFTITAGVSRQGPVGANPSDAGSSTQPSAISWNAGITIPLPLFNRNQGNVQKAEIAALQTQKQIDAKELSIRQEINGLWDQLSLGEALIGDYENSQLKRAREVRDAQQRQFGTGNSALLDYLDAVSAYQGALSAYYDVIAEYRRNLARIGASLGKDLEP